MFTSLYLLLVVAMALFSWIANVYGFMLVDGEVVPSLLSAESLRWFVRHCMQHIASAPFAVVLLVLMIVGVIRNVGLVQYFVSVFRKREFPQLSRKQRYALSISLGVLLVGVVWLIYGITPLGGNLLSVSGEIAGGPFSRGWLFLLWLLVGVPCLVYGWVSGLWHTGKEMLGALSSELSRCSSYFVTFVVASQLMAALHYMGLFLWLGADWAIVVEVLLYGAPLGVCLYGDRG